MTVAHCTYSEAVKEDAEAVQFVLSCYNFEKEREQREVDKNKRKSKRK